jgi:hypothetical protein
MLAKFAWEGDDSFPGQDLLAALLRVDERTVRTWVTELRCMPTLRLNTGAKVGQMYICGPFPTSGKSNTRSRQIEDAAEPRGGKTMSSSMDRVVERLEKALGPAGEAGFVWWRPRPGERLAGRVVRRFSVHGRWGVRDALVVEGTDGTLHGVVLTTALAEAWGAADVGWFVAAEFCGKRGVYLEYRTSAMSPEQVKEVEREGV